MYLDYLYKAIAHQDQARSHVFFCIFGAWYWYTALASWPGFKKCFTGMARG